jgi:choline dehydrogenase
MMFSTSANAADFIIVGAGSAGCVLAARLSEDAGCRVIVIEHGGTDFGPLIAMPAALAYPLNMTRYDWGFRTVPEPFLGGRRLACPRGKVIGGSSSINGMVYVQGHARDFDTWAQLGASGWSSADVAPYFKRMEASHGGEADARGQDGPVHVTRGDMTNPLFAAFIEAGRQAGYPVTTDYNGHSQEGFCALERTIWQGRRWSAADAYLKPAMRRDNLRVVRGFARRITFEGRRATGIEVERNGRIEVLRAAREVIVAASAINAPKLLLLSGIGPAAELAELGIGVLANRPGVGRNLQDHLEVYVQYVCRQPITLNAKLGLLSKAMTGAQWLLTRQGDGASNHFEAGAFLRSGADVDYPDIQMHFLPAAIRYDGYAARSGHGFQIHVGPMRSRSRGWVRLAAPDPAVPPLIQFNYMSDAGDWAEFRHCVRLVRDVVRQPALAPFAGPEISPGTNLMSDQALDDYLKDAVESAYHPCGTVRMGDANDTQAVVDPQCRVIGVEGLRVVDSSIFPQITNGNLNAPSMMVAEKAADHILGKQLLARAETAS